MKNSVWWITPCDVSDVSRFLHILFYDMRKLFEFIWLEKILRCIDSILTANPLSPEIFWHLHLVYGFKVFVSSYYKNGFIQTVLDTRVSRILTIVREIHNSKYPHTRVHIRLCDFRQLAGHWFVCLRDYLCKE